MKNTILALSLTAVLAFGAFAGARYFGGTPDCCAKSSCNRTHHQ